MHPGIFADDKQAVAARNGQYITMHLTVDAQTVDKSQLAAQYRAFADQVANWHLSLGFEPHGAASCLFGLRDQFASSASSVDTLRRDHLAFLVADPHLYCFYHGLRRMFNHPFDPQVLAQLQ